jgi:hypothetical protein
MNCLVELWNHGLGTIIGVLVGWAAMNAFITWRERR